MEVPLARDPLLLDAKEVAGCPNEWSEFRRFFFGTGRRARAITFYSESPGYFQYFEGVLRALRARPAPGICYLTSDPLDPLLRSPVRGLNVFFFRSLLPFVLQFLDARVLVMTMTDLHRFHVRRSLRGAHHVYLFHALVSTHMIYRFGAFDHYDTLLCAGPHHVREIRRAEELYHLSPKRLLETGYPRLDNLIERHRQVSPGEGRAAGGSILIAPSWAPENVLETCGIELARGLAKDGQEVVVRPHPEYAKRNPRWIESFGRELAQIPGTRLDLDYSSLDSLHRADLLITDWSGIALEYAFAMERPVLYLDVPRKVNNPRYEELGLIPLEVEIREKIGRVVPPGDIPRLCAEARRMLSERESYREGIRRERAAAVFHVGASSVAAADAILELCGTV